MNLMFSSEKGNGSMRIHVSYLRLLALERVLKSISTVAIFQFVAAAQSRIFLKYLPGSSTLGNYGPTGSSSGTWHNITFNLFQTTVFYELISICFFSVHVEFCCCGCWCFSINSRNFFSPGPVSIENTGA